MKVYRVGHLSRTQDIEGVIVPLGPYAGLDWSDVSDAHEEMLYAHSNMSHPAPRYCPKLRCIATEEICGFDSMESLLNWFERYHSTLTDSGYCVFVYDVDDEIARVGTLGQVVFSVHFAEEVDSFPLPLADTQLAIF